MNAAAQHAAQKRLLEEWEPESFAKLAQRRIGVAIQREVCEEEASMKDLLEDILTKTAEQLETWLSVPTSLEKDALKIVALYVQDKLMWMVTNDILFTRIAALLMGKQFRAHSEGVFQYRNGAFWRVEELPEVTMRRCERALNLAAEL